MIKQTWARALVLALLLAAVLAPAAAPHEEMGTSHPSAKKITVKASTRPAPGGVLVRLRTVGYRWAPEHLSPIHGKGKVVQGEGHGHFYVDGAKTPTTMVVGPWTYLKLAPGGHRLRVTLNANDHNEWTWHGKTVQSTVKVKVPKPTMG
jgi:hypothetical protein